MKNFKIALVTLLTATLIIAVSSFTIKSYNSRAFAILCYELINVTINTPALNAGNGTARTDFINTANWVLTNQAGINANCTGPNKVCGICFDPGSTAIHGRMH